MLLSVTSSILDTLKNVEFIYFTIRYDSFQNFHLLTLQCLKKYSIVQDNWVYNDRNNN